VKGYWMGKKRGRGKDADHITSPKKKQVFEGGIAPLRKETPTGKRGKGTKKRKHGEEQDDHIRR